MESKVDDEPTVEVKPLIGYNVATGKQQRSTLYQVFYDGERVGFIGWESPMLCLHTQMGPIERDHVTEQVGLILDRDVVTKSPPVVPDELLNPQPESDEYDNDDFDT